MMAGHNRKWLILIAIILAGIFAIMLIGVVPKKQESKISDSISAVVDSIRDETKEFREEMIDEIGTRTENTRQ